MELQLDDNAPTLNDDEWKRLSFRIKGVIADTPREELQAVDTGQRGWEIIKDALADAGIERMQPGEFRGLIYTAVPRIIARRDGPEAEEKLAREMESFGDALQGVKLLADGEITYEQLGELMDEGERERDTLASLTKGLGEA